MLFSSATFLFVFLPLVLLLYFGIFVHFPRGRNVFLLIASLFFYAWGEPVNVYLMMTVILINWMFGMLIKHFREKECLACTALIVAVILDIGILGYFKYGNFLSSNVNRLFGTGLPVPDIALPLGISFFIFQAVSYVADVFRGEAKAQVNPLYVGLYISFFPQLIAGPIVRYRTVEKQIRERKETFHGFSEGHLSFYDRSV